MSGSRAARTAFWLLGLLAVLVFVLTGRPLAGEGSASTIPDIWWQLASWLPSPVASMHPGTVLVGLTAVLAIGFAAGLWFALSGPASATEGEPLPLSDAGRSAYRALRRPARSRALWPDRMALGLLALFAVVVAYRMDGFVLWRTVEAPGGAVTLPDTFAAVDHPFHAARAETLRRSIAEGDLPQWMADHQGGYPVEFYPLGVPWLEIGLWAVTGGTLPILSVHKLFVTLVFLAPALLFGLAARQDRLQLAVAVLAFTFHVWVPGGPWTGGYTELVQMGLVTNVTAAIVLLATLLALMPYLQRGSPRSAVAAAALAALAVYCNPRSLVGLGALVLAAALSRLIPSGASGSELRTLVARLGVVGGLSALLAAPELVPLIRFRALYEFVRYTWYDAPADFTYALFEAASAPVAIAGTTGVVLAFQRGTPPVLRTVAIAWVIYSLFTLAASSPVGIALVPQLEATRLMPLQRLLTMYLAAYAIALLLRRVALWLWPRGIGRPDLLTLAFAAVLFVFVAAPSATGLTIGPLYAVETSATVETVDFAEALDHAGKAAPGATAVLVVGSSLSTHQQLWAPTFADRRFFYDDWLWFWQPHHAAPGAPATDRGLIDEAVALSRPYLELHAVGAVAVTGEARARAAVASYLTPVRIGTQRTYDVFRVRSPTSLVTFPGMGELAVEADAERITARGYSAGGEAVIRHNWFPRWRAMVNGTPAPIRRTPGSYMTVLLPAGDVRLELRYARDLMDWAATGAALAGCGSSVGLLLLRRRSDEPG